MTSNKKITPAFRAASLLGMGVLLAVLTMPCAFGAQDIVKVNIPFPFQVVVGADHTTLPAGEYAFHFDDEASIVSVTNSSRGDSVMVQILARLAATPYSNATDAHMVFDNAGTTYTLSELWRPGGQGLLMQATRGTHDHQVLHVAR